MQHEPAETPILERNTVTVIEAAKILGIGRSAAYEGARTGEIPTIKIGRRVLVPITALNRKLENPSPDA